MEEMTNVTSMITSLITWLAYSVALMLLLRKLKGKHFWRAWIPGLRFAALGEVLDIEQDGLICGILDTLTAILRFWTPVTSDDNVEVILSLVTLVILVLQLVYEIRVFLRLAAVMGARKRWVFVWLLANWIPVAVFALSSRYQPHELGLSDERKAGTSPAPVSGQGRRGDMAETGLSVELKERTVRDFNKKRYLLKDISLDIPNGSLVLLLGGSGSGKTTFVNAVIGYEKADARVLLNGADVYRDYDRVKYRIGFVPQQNLIRGNDTVYRTVTDAAELRLPASVPNRQRDERVAEVMDLLGLAAGQEGLVAKKSGGQLRRISIAMELVANPELFVLDEPDSGLDGVIAREIFTKLRAIADEGKIVIVITHTPDRVIDLFDKVIVLARDSGRVGRLAFYGSPQEAREFFGKDSMEGIVMSVNRKEEGGDGMADEYIERFARRAADREEAQA